MTAGRHYGNTWALGAAPADPHDSDEYWVDAGQSWTGVCPGSDDGMRGVRPLVDDTTSEKIRWRQFP